jgi:predicted RNA polymerase sigma factor
VTTADLLRDLAPVVLGVLVRRHGRFDECEDALQEALLAASRSWPVDGPPANPTGWLVTAASRRLVDTWRRDAARRRRETADAVRPGPAPAQDDTLTLFLLCCHPVLAPPSQVALTLRAVGGLTTAEIARGLLVPEATVAQRISRAKARIRSSGAGFGDAHDLARLPAVLHVLNLVFTEGHTATSGMALQRTDLTAEAIRLCRALHARLPGEGEVAGLLALMLLTDARRPARLGPDGALVPLEEQDRTCWDRAAVAEGTALLESVLATAVPGPFQLQAAIAAVHAGAATARDTDWPQILGLYDLLAALAPSPVVTLNRVVAVAMVHGPGPALRELDALATDSALAGHHRVDAVRAHLLERAGRAEEARAHYRRAAQRTLSVPERRYLLARAAER